jgi:hypothetical protein
MSAERKNAEGVSLWADIVKEYSRRKLSLPGDRLSAIAGIVKILESSWSDTCIAGLWRSQLVQNLFWIRAINVESYQELASESQAMQYMKRQFPPRPW